MGVIPADAQFAVDLHVCAFFSSEQEKIKYVLIYIFNTVRHNLISEEVSFYHNDKRITL